jgi:hypothetical protein
MPMGQMPMGLGSGSMGLMDDRMMQIMQMLQALRGASGFGAAPVQQGMRPSTAQFQPQAMPMQAAPMQQPQGPQGGGMGDMMSMLPMLMMMMQKKGLGSSGLIMGGNSDAFQGVPSGFRM